MKFISRKKFKADFPMTWYTLKTSDFLQENMLWLLAVTLIPLGWLGWFLFKTERGQFMRDKYIWKIPVLGSLLHKTNIEIFCRVFYALYSGSGENIEVIKMAAQACGNKYMEFQINTVALPMMIEKGAGITEAFEASNVFTKTAISRLHSGAETGTVKNTAQQLADYYEQETTFKMKNVVDFVSLWVNMIIMIVLLALTLASSETATFHPSTQQSEQQAEMKQQALERQEDLQKLQQKK